MRQGQQNNNKRMRGRNRKSPNPMSRSYESNGPDVKIRGTALHIAEKYVQLARDAQASGDRVAAESYFQHAEHYYRIIAAAQAQMPQPQPIYRHDEEGDEDDMDEGGFQPPYAPQNEQQGRPWQNEGGGQQRRFDQQGRGSYQQGEGRPYQERGDRPYQDRQDRPYQQGERGYGQGERAERPERQAGERGDRHQGERARPENDADRPRPAEQPAVAGLGDQPMVNGGFINGLPASLVGGEQPAGTFPEGEGEGPGFRSRRRRSGRGRSRRGEGAEGSEGVPAEASANGERDFGDAGEDARPAGQPADEG
jgi:hypothetical protein